MESAPGAAGAPGRGGRGGAGGPQQRDPGPEPVLLGGVGLRDTAALEAPGGNVGGAQCSVSWGFRGAPGRGDSRRSVHFRSPYALE